MRKFLTILFLMLMSFMVLGAEVAPVDTKIHTITIVLGCLFAISELLAELKVFEGNSVFQMIKNILSVVYKALTQK